MAQNPLSNRASLEYGVSPARKRMAGAPTLNPTPTGHLKINASNERAGESKARGIHYANDYDERRYADLLQRLGQGTAGSFQPWLAVERGRMGRPDDVSGGSGIPLHRARPAGSWEVRSAMGRERDEYLRE